MRHLQTELVPPSITFSIRTSFGSLHAHLAVESYFDVNNPRKKRIILYCTAHYFDTTAVHIESTPSLQEQNTHKGAAFEGVQPRYNTPRSCRPKTFYEGNYEKKAAGLRQVHVSLCRRSTPATNHIEYCTGRAYTGNIHSVVANPSRGSILDSAGRAH